MDDSSHGDGTFNLSGVIVNEPVTSGIPTVSDTDEEVTVTWEACSSMYQLKKFNLRANKRS